VVCASTFDAGLTANFNIALESSEDAAATLTALPASPDARSAESPVGRGATPPTAPQLSADYPPASAAATQPPTAASEAGSQYSGEPKLTVEGQGLSDKQKADTEALIAAALGSISGPDGRYEDPEFGADAASLGQSPHAERVTSWRRPAEIGGPKARLWKNDWEVEGLDAGPLANEWLLGAANILGGDRDILAKVFVSTEHAARGLYALRFWQDDPASDDDWKVVVVDDRLPCGADGSLVFARCADGEVFWAAILEKALAKLHGSYAATEAANTSEAALLGLELLSGGKAKQRPLPLRGGNADEIWAQLQQAARTAHVIGVRIDPAAPSAAGAAALGLRADRSYCVVTCGEMPCGKMLRLRGFIGDSEWTGPWSDGDAAWTSRLRQLLNYRDASDGTFWIEFGDLAAHFTDLCLVRMADDRWSRMTMRSRWADETAGGGPNGSTFRCNPQWLVTVRRPQTRLLVELTLPPSAPPAPLGLLVLRGNAPPDARRRKLWLAEGDIVAHAEPRIGRRNTVELLLEPSETPYVLVPYAESDGYEANFQLTVLSDDREDDGKPDFGLQPLRPATDWHSTRLTIPLERVARLPGAVGAHLPFRLGGGGGDGADKGRVFAFADIIGLASDMRAQAGMQTSRQYPALGAAIAPIAAGVAPLTTLPSGAIAQPPTEADGISFGAELPSLTPHAFVPCISESGVATLANAPQVVLTLYSDRPIEAGGASDQVAADSLDPCGCAICSADGKKRRLCIRARANLPCEAFRHRVGGAIGPRPLRTCSDECVR